MNITKPTHRCREQTTGYLRGEGRDGGQNKGRGLKGNKYYA